MGRALVSNRILLVEDEDDLRDLLCEWLAAQGYDLASAASAEEGLERLREENFGLLVTDYLLPGETGLDLARAALDEHLVEGPERVILTSATPPRKEAAELGIDILQKPVALPSLVEAIERHRPHEGSEERHAHLALVPTEDSGQPRAEVSLVLYVTSTSLASVRAISRVRRIVASLGEGAVDLEIRDVDDDPEAAAADRIAFTPTLVRVHPSPRIRLIGDFEDGGVVLRELLPPESETGTG
jgi:DNA-binding response OmpR family regulator